MKYEDGKSDTLKTPVVLWQVEINKFEEYDDSGNYDSIELEYFQDEANAKAWLLEAKAKIAPLDQWVNDKYEDGEGRIYTPFIYQLRTKD